MLDTSPGLAITPVRGIVKIPTTKAVSVSWGWLFLNRLNAKKRLSARIATVK
jgi:hypothetical protein